MNGNVFSQDVFHGAHVLVVEDDFLVSLELQSMLEDAGAEVGVCRSVDEALAAARTDTIAAAVLDFRLGHETIHPVARMLAVRGTPIVFYTGQTEEAGGLLAAWPHSMFIAKPAPACRVVSAVADVLQITPADDRSTRRII